MARPKATELTARELAVMRVFWQCEHGTAEDVHRHLNAAGDKLAYPTVANVVRALADKGYLEQLNRDRPFVFRAVRPFQEVSQRLVLDLVNRLFAGSRQAMLVQLLDDRQLSPPEREFLVQVLREQES